MAWIKAFGEGLPAPFIEPCASNETLVDLLARLAFSGKSKSPDVPAQPGDTSLTITHASNPLLKGLDSLQRIFRILNAQAMATGIDQLYSLDPIQVLYVSTFQRKLIDRCGGNPDIYFVHLAETSETLSACVRDQAYDIWCHFLHLHCRFPLPDSDFVRSDQERISSNVANRKLFQMVHQGAKNATPADSPQVVDMDFDSTHQEGPSNVDQEMLGMQYTEGDIYEEELGEEFGVNLYEDDAE